MGSCRSCGAPITSAQFRFCPICGLPLTADAPRGGEGVPFASARAAGPALGATAPPVTLVELEADGAKGAPHRLAGDETTIGRSGADITFPDDACLSPLHALLTWRDGQLTLRDLGSRNGTWVYLEGPHKLADGETILIGSQLLRFRRLGYPAPHPPEADSTRRLGSLTPAADIACLIQLRSDGSERDVLHLSPGRAITLGRERGDWTFPYDPSMSAAHAAIRSEDADFVLADAGSRNGVALAARGEVELKKGFRFLVGDKLLAVEMP